MPIYGTCKRCRGETLDYCCPACLEDQQAKALEYAAKYAGIDGAHHKDWVIDQMVRALTGCPRAPMTGEQGESEEYRQFVADACAGEDGPETYDWDVGIAP